MKDQIQFVEARDGSAVDYCQRVLRAYRSAARSRSHHAHLMPYRPHFVMAIMDIRRYLREVA